MDRQERVSRASSTRLTLGAASYAAQAAGCSPVESTIWALPRTVCVARANATEYGLCAYIFTGDIGRGLRVARRIESGMIALNRGLVSDPAAPFGGVKQSGLGREGGTEGIYEFLETKYIAASI